MRLESFTYDWEKDEALVDFLGYDGARMIREMTCQVEMSDPFDGDFIFIGDSSAASGGPAEISAHLSAVVSISPITTHPRSVFR